MQYVPFSSDLPLLNIMPSRYILIVANGRISFSWLSNIPLCVGTVSCLSINALMGSCFHILAIVNNVTANREVQTSFPYAVFISLDIHPEVVLLDHMVMLFLLFWGTFIQFSIMAEPMCIPTNSVQGFTFLHILANNCYACLFNNSHANRCEVISHCGFDLLFPSD